MFRIESYVTPILLSYVDKYVRDFKPIDAQVSLWGGGVALHNLVLKTEVLQQEVALPFTLVSGRIHELLIQVPWTKIMSEPIVVTIDTIECVLSPNPSLASEDTPPPESPSRRNQMVEAPPGYMQALVRKIVSNISLRIHHLIVKYVQDDIIMSLNVKHLTVDSAGPNWEPAFADIDQVQPVIRRLVGLDDLTLCLDKADSDGKIRFYQEPLLYRCQLELRVLTKLVSASTRRASNLSVQMRSSKLAWGVTSEQLTLLFRLVREKADADIKPPTPAPKSTNVTQNVQPHVTSAMGVERNSTESWSQWAWSWLPTWMDREDVDDSPLSPTPIPINFTAYFDDVSLVFKVMELESSTRKRARSILEVSATHAAIKSYICSPTSVRVRIGTRTLTLLSKGKCVCGHSDYNALNGEPTYYLKRIDEEPVLEAWMWPEDQIIDVIETAQAIDEHYVSSVQEEIDKEPETQSEHGHPEEPSTNEKERVDPDDFWHKMSPQVFIEYNHERMPPSPQTNPYDNPLTDFMYSDWIEESVMKVTVKPMKIRVCMGLVHRLSVFNMIYQDLPPVPVPEISLRVLTVEECEALSENLPQQRITFEANGVRLRLIPWDHIDRPTLPPIVLDVDLPNNVVVINGPLYPHRVCSAACQMPENSGPVWQGARLHITVNMSSVSAAICASQDKKTRPCARAHVRGVAHMLLNKHYFTRTESVLFGYSVKISEANVCGSAARLQAALQVPLSLINKERSMLLQHTTLPQDALNDEESVAIDLTLEDMVFRGYKTNYINTHILVLQSAKATVLQEQKGEEKQAWLFSAPDAPVSSPYLRLAVQWCSEPLSYSIDYVGLWTEPTAVAIDPLFIAWLAYKPTVKTTSETSLGSTKTMPPHYFIRRKATPPSSSGRGASKTGSGPELIHIRTRSTGSSDRAESRDIKSLHTQDKEKHNGWSNEQMLNIHERLRRMYVNVEIGLTLVYVTMTSASAVDCATIRDTMERHANLSHKVLALSCGRLFIFSSTIKGRFWNDINHDGPTFITSDKDKETKAESFPWRIRLADVSCYTLELTPSSTTDGRDLGTGLKSQLRGIHLAKPRTILELVTTTVTLSVVTKTVHIKMTKKEPKVKTESPKVEDEKTRYFKQGMDFKPTTLKEFVRGPAAHSQRKSNVAEQPKKESVQVEVVAGPVVSLGVHLHADTPPLMFRMDHDQVHIMTASLHCFAHIISLLRRPPLNVPRYLYTSHGGSHRSLIRSVSETENVRMPSEDTTSDNRSELISIFETRSIRDNRQDLKTFFWFQWVISRVSVVVAGNQMKLTFAIDDIISTVDLQDHYNQLKIKVASASIRYYKRQGRDEWSAGLLNGRVLEAREPADVKEDNHFLAITVTQAQISNLPASWKEELHPKLLEQKTADSMWEIYATLAPLEAVLQPTILKHIVLLMNEMVPKSFCPVKKESSTDSMSTWQWPFCYVTAGGLRLLITGDEEIKHKDDTFMFVVGKLTISPHPENPICRRAINTGTETGWLTTGGAFEGRQYEVMMKQIGIRSAQFKQLVLEESTESQLLQGTSVENPALKWAQPVEVPIITPVLHSVDIGCVLAPPFYYNGILTCGPAVELNLVSDCSIELSLQQINLIENICGEIKDAFDKNDEMVDLDEDYIVDNCPYAEYIMAVNEPDEELVCVSSQTLADSIPLDTTKPEVLRSATADSGVDTSTPSTLKNSRMYEESHIPGVAAKKSVSIACVEQMDDLSEFLEVFVTMGMIELSLYMTDYYEPATEILRPPQKWERTKSPEIIVQIPVHVEKAGSSSIDDRDGGSNKGSHISLTEEMRDVGICKAKMMTFPRARTAENSLPLLHLTLYQPNLYYWRKRLQKTLQVSLFNAWLGLGAGPYPDIWHEVLFSTAKGVSDPVTDIPPALATIKVVIPFTGSSPNNTATRGTVKIDIERPIQLEVSSERLQRLIAINGLVKSKTKIQDYETENVSPTIPFFYKLKRMFVHNFVESVTIQTSQISLCGEVGVIGWDSSSLQIAAGIRPDRLVARGHLCALLVASGPPGDNRHVILQPLMLGVKAKATWEAWRRGEDGVSAKEPMVRVSLEVDRVTIDVRPTELVTLADIQQQIDKLLQMYKDQQVSSIDKKRSESVCSVNLAPTSVNTSINFDQRPSAPSIDSTDEHFYKDDLRSGAFKIVSGGQLPMAYQVTLHEHAVSWRYPHPRAITRLVAYPLPDQDKEISCVLELYNSQLYRWEAHTNFNIPVSEPNEMILYVTPPDAVFAVMWRYRACDAMETKDPPFEFNVNKFLPRTDPLQHEYVSEIRCVGKSSCGVTAEQLSGVVRVDSCFSPRMAPKVRLVTRIANFALHLHNAPPSVTSQSTSLEGYYVSKPLMRCHRVLSIVSRDTTAYAQLASPAGSLFLINTYLSSDVLDCATGTMEQLVNDFRVQGGVTLPTGCLSRSRVSLSRVHVALHVPRLRTLHTLAQDWQTAVQQYVRKKSDCKEVPVSPLITKHDSIEETALELEGLVSLWVHNTCASALRVGQEGTDEVVPLGPGASLAYRWRSPTSTKKLRFSLAGPSTDWQWSKSISFAPICSRVKLIDSELASKNDSRLLLHTKVEEIGSRRCMRLAGRLCLANMLKANLLYKVRGRCETNQWRTLCSGELNAETMGKSVVCGEDCDLALKIKFNKAESGWSGDIPLKECPKENVPWLVKVPCDSDIPFVSVWCRVVRGRTDGRILATVWPLYVLYSQLPLDTDVVIMTQNPASSVGPTEVGSQTPLIQTAPGRGTSTHLFAPGTTSARHTLSFQYRNIDCPVTQEAVPLHYGVTNTSVFDKRQPVASIDDVLEIADEWLKRSGSDAVSSWPYSVVTKHYPHDWQPALMQPRCDVTVRYQAIRAGGGCSLEVQLCPVVLLCNAAPIPLTLRAHDAAPLCKLEPGTALSPPSAVLEKSFFISIEMGRETFVSGELSVSGAELGRYGELPPGRVALDRPAELSIQCNHKVALLTMYYEIKQDINILGMSSTYVLMNRMKKDVLVSAIAVANETSEDAILRPSTFKVVEPTPGDSFHGTPLCRFWVSGRWRNSDPCELRLYLYVTLETGANHTRATPIRLGHPPMRRAIALIDSNDMSVPVVVTQMKHEGRWVITVAEDPCPQLVVQNLTLAPLAVAQPIRAADEPSTSKVMVETECAGTRWHCVIKPGNVTHYSTPAHCMRYPPPNALPSQSVVTFLTFGHPKGDMEPVWCAPVAATDGEQLVQLNKGVTIKMRVRTHPHSTHIELKSVDEHDISASDIRKRLFGAFSAQDPDTNIQNSRANLDRIDADEKLLKTASGDVNPGSSSVMSHITTTTMTLLSAQDDTKTSPSSTYLYKSIPLEEEQNSKRILKYDVRGNSGDAADMFCDVTDPEWDETACWSACDRFRVVAAAVAAEFAATSDAQPLVAIHLDRAALLVRTDIRRTKTTISISDVQIDNPQYESGQYDFGVVATTRGGASPTNTIPPLWNMFGDKDSFSPKQKDARALLRLTHDSWTVLNYNYTELTEIDIGVGPVALYIEDAFVTSVASVWRRAMPPALVSEAAAPLADERALQHPLTLRSLHINPLDLTLTLHTAVRMYIALDQSPLRLSAFKLHDVMTSTERLTHALTVHYLSAAILGAGWVVGGLELLGAPGALAARVGGATGGVRGVASAAAAGLLRSLSAWAGSLARNLDLLAGDEEHARRAAAARRRPPPSFIAGLAAGITNFAINILGAVGGLAHHPLVGVAVGESESGATALRRGIIGALAKPLSATADLVAFAGHGLLTQTGWDPEPQRRETREWECGRSGGWPRDCVRWCFRLAELNVLAGFHVMLDGAPLHIILTHKFLVVTDPDTERIVEMIDLRFCNIGPYQGQIIELVVIQKKPPKAVESRAPDEDDEYQISAAAMARVARYTGAAGAAGEARDARVLSLLPSPGHSHSLHASLAAAAHNNADSHFSLL